MDKIRKLYKHLAKLHHAKRRYYKGRQRGLPSGASKEVRKIEKKQNELRLKIQRLHDELKIAPEEVVPD